MSSKRNFCSVASLYILNLTSSASILSYIYMCGSGSSFLIRIRIHNTVFNDEILSCVLFVCSEELIETIVRVAENTVDELTRGEGRPVSTNLLIYCVLCLCFGPGSARIRTKKACRISMDRCGLRIRIGIRAVPEVLE